MCEFRLLAVGDLGLVFWAQEDVWHVEAGDDGKCFVDAVVLLAGHE